MGGVTPAVPLLATSFYMNPVNRQFGAWCVNAHVAPSPVDFSLFFPNRAYDSRQYGPDGLTFDEKPRNINNYGCTNIASITVIGDFQQQLGQQNWMPVAANTMACARNGQGDIWQWTTPRALKAGFYQYQYVVTFINGETRRLSDPCARYGGDTASASAFVVGPSKVAAVKQLACGRRPLRELVVYELNIDDFANAFWYDQAAFDVIRTQLDYLVKLGINAIHFLPWTAWGDNDFNWGYAPQSFFAVEHRYTHDRSGREPDNFQLSRLRELISACHDRGIHVIMDGVFNHARPIDAKVSSGFIYPCFYQDPQACPYTGQFGGTFPGLLDLDYHNTCTQEYVHDVCYYWMDEFDIDGFRLDNTTNYYVQHDSRGLPTLLQDIRQHASDLNFSITLEHLDLSAANVVNLTGATSYWNNALYERCFEAMWWGEIDGRLLTTMDTQRGLISTPMDKVATTYLSNHDHSHVTWQCGARTNEGSMTWYRTQPFAIAQFTMPGTPLVMNGQEFGEDRWMPEDDHGSGRRVVSRPLHWEYSKDCIGERLHWLYQRLIDIRKQYPALQSDNIYPLWSPGQTTFNADGYGFNAEKQVLIYHRYGTVNGTQQRFIIALNFSAQPQTVDIPFSANGNWQDLLPDAKPVYLVQYYRLPGWIIQPYWGHVFVEVLAKRKARSHS